MLQKIQHSCDRCGSPLNGAVQHGTCDHCGAYYSIVEVKEKINWTEEKTRLMKLAGISRSTAGSGIQK